MLKNFFAKVKDNSDVLSENIVEIGSDILIEGVVGQLAPGIISVRNAYKQRQLEESLIITISEINHKVDILSERIEDLSNEELAFVEKEVFPVFFDHVLEEPEKGKIKYFISGFETIIEHKFREKDLILSYFDVLRSLRINEIGRLISQTPEYRMKVYSEDAGYTLNSEIIDQLQDKSAFIKYMDNKLEQLGLIQTIVFTERDITPEYSPITKFGNNFISFIRAIK